MNYYLATQVHDLLNSSSAGEISHSPGSLLLSLEVTLDQDVDERLKNSGVHHSLDLITVAGGDVAHSPGGLLDDVHLGVLQELGEHGDGVVLEHGVGLRVVAGDHVAEGAEARRHHLQLPAVKQPHQVGDHTGVDNTLKMLKLCYRVYHQNSSYLNLLVGAVSEVGERPAGVGQHLLVLVLDQLGQDGEALLHHLEGRARVLVAAQVGDGPGHVAEERGRGLGVDEGDQRLDHAVVDDEVPHGGPVTGDVAQGPHGLLLHIVVGAAQELDEMWNSTAVDHGLGLVRGPGGDVGQGPGGLELQGWVVEGGQELHQPRHDSKTEK